MDMKRPNPEQAAFGLRAMKTIAMADGTLDDSERHLINAIQAIFGTVHPIEELLPITPAELAAALPDHQIRRQLVQGMIIMSMIDKEVSPQETDLIEQFAKALEVSAHDVSNLRHVFKEELFQLRLDVARRFWVRDKIKATWNEEGLLGVFKAVGGMLGQHEHADLAARYQALEHYPAGSLGRSYYDYCRQNGFRLPGEKGGAAELVVFHDCTHVLSGYGTDPEGEVQVACFSAGYRRRDPFIFVFFVLLQFHVGIRMTPIITARTGFFNPEKALIALQRGAAMNIDLTDGWDYWPVMREPVEELRRRYNILPPESFRPQPQS
jgi:uncharacterized tellurite resistance protein B-like protein